MNDIYNEQLVKRETTKKIMLQRALIIFAAVFVMLVMMFIL